MEENSPQGIWDHIAEKMLMEFAESGCPIFRATTPLSRGKLKSKGHGKLSIHFTVPIGQRLRLFFAYLFLQISSVFTEQSRNMCEGCESLHDRSGQPDKVMGQSIVLSEIKTEVPLDNDDPAYQNLLLQRYEERIKSLSQTDRVSKFCMDAGFRSVVGIGQYFMTKETMEISENSIQWPVVNTLFQEKKQHHIRKDGSKGTPKLDPCWKLQPVTCTVNMEWKSELYL